MALLLSNIGCLAPFNTEGVDHHALSQVWKKWLRSFQILLDARGAENHLQKKQLLLHSAGIQVQEIYFSSVTDEVHANNNFDQTINLLDNYFIPRANVPFERHLFRQEGQKSDETVDQFVCRLKQRASTCEFGNNLNEQIRDQVVEKCCSTTLRKKLLEKKI